MTDRRSGEIGRQEGGDILERSISALHSTISTISFFASSGFYLSSASLNSASILSIRGLNTLNAILGSTESSRAVAAIITLIKDELNKPEEGSRGEVVTYFDLVTSTIGFALLQRWARRKTERDFREAGGEEVIWDAVIDDKGFRADVVGTRKTDLIGMPKELETSSFGRRPVSFLSPGGDEMIDVVERGSIYPTDLQRVSMEAQYVPSDDDIRDHIIKQLPEGAHANISSETITAKTIKVDIYNTPVTDLVPPPGTRLLSEHIDHSDSDDRTIPHQTILFRTAFTRSSSEPDTSRRLLSAASQMNIEPTQEDDVVTMKHSPSRMHDDRLTVARYTYAVNFDDDKEGGTPIEALSGPVANQKKARMPQVTTSADQKPSNIAKTALTSLTKRSKSYTTPQKSEKSNTLKKAFKSLSPSQSSTTIKDNAQYVDAVPSPGSKTFKLTSSNKRMVSSLPRLSSSNINKPLPLLQPMSPLPDRSRPLGNVTNHNRQSSTTRQYYTVTERRRESSVSETVSVHSVESRPGSPNLTRVHSRTTTGLTKTQSEQDAAVWGLSDDRPRLSVSPTHHRSRSHLPSLYSVKTDRPDEEIILAPRVPMRQNSLFEDQATLLALAQDGIVPGIFPKTHLVRSVRRFARFASASYGSQFLRIMGITNPDGDVEKLAEPRGPETDFDIHHEHDSFSKHTGLPPHTILLSSFQDKEGGGVSISNPSAMLPLVHFVSLDEDSKAVVLTCRGTLGFEDVLTDMTCDYDDLYYRGNTYKVHKGIHASARRMLSGQGSRVMAALRDALNERPDYGLILCGHSLGGAVAALLAVLISEPSTVSACGASFCTSTQPKLLSSLQLTASTPPVQLPTGRPIHVYAYGTPACVSSNLRLATRGLITTTINSHDIVPSLSLGTLHDFRSVALSLKTDTTGALAALKTRVWARIRNAVQTAFYTDAGPPPPGNVAGDGLGEDTWAWAALKTLRAGMQGDKLVPPGECFIVETSRVFDRGDGGSAGGGGVAGDSATERVFRSLGRPATRVQMKFVRDVEGRFGELRFGSRMFGDHSPGRYEGALAALEGGILGE